MPMTTEMDAAFSSDGSESSGSPKSLGFGDPRSAVMPDRNNQCLWASLKRHNPLMQSPKYSGQQYGDNLLILPESDPVNPDNFMIRSEENMPLFDECQRMTEIGHDHSRLSSGTIAHTGSEIYDGYAPEITHQFSDNIIISPYYSYDTDLMACPQDFSDLNYSLLDSDPYMVGNLATCPQRSPVLRQYYSNMLISMVVSVGGAILDFSIPVLQSRTTGMHISEVLNPEEIDKFFSAMNSVLTSYETETFRHCLRLSDGDECWEALSIISAIPSNQNVPSMPPLKLSPGGLFSPESCYSVFVRSALIAPCPRCRSGHGAMSRPSEKYSAPTLRGITIMNEQKEVMQWQSNVLLLDGSLKEQEAKGKLSSSTRGCKVKRQRRSRSKKKNEDPRCVDCGALNSPEWRRGPSGLKTLCNACGLRWSKSEKKRQLALENNRRASIATTSSVVTPTKSARGDEASDSDKSINRSGASMASSSGLELDPLLVSFSPYIAPDSS